jgi:transposase
MADDRCNAYQSSPPRLWRGWRQQSDESYKRGLNTKIHLAVDAHGMPVRFTVTEGTTADCTQACALIDGVDADCLFADKAYDTNEIIEFAQKHGMGVVIPPKRNRTQHRDYDAQLYKLRHLVENAFLHIKRWRGLATRYAKNFNSFVAVVQIRCLFMWLSIL